MHDRKRDSLKVAFALFTGFSTPAAFAGSMGAVSPYHYVATLSAGPAWQNGGATQTLFLSPEIEKIYAANKSVGTLADVEVFLGMQRAFNNTLQGQLGAAVGVTSDAKLSGIIWDDADPQFDNYYYSYKLQHTHIALKGKLLADMGYLVTPWVSGSVGVGFNRAYSFNNIPLIAEAVKNPNFVSHTQTSFTYTVGAGVQRALNTNWQLGIGYEFADWGKSRLGRAQQQTTNNGLTLNHLYTNGFMVNITYIA